MACKNRYFYLLKYKALLTSFPGQTNFALLICSSREFYIKPDIFTYYRTAFLIVLLAFAQFSPIICGKFQIYKLGNTKLFPDFTYCPACKR
jgi:hypothetical protein